MFPATVKLNTRISSIDNFSKTMLNKKTWLFPPTVNYLFYFCFSIVIIKNLFLFLFETPNKKLSTVQTSKACLYFYVSL
jgi:hypothetical protein